MFIALNLNPQSYLEANLSDSTEARPAANVDVFHRPPREDLANWLTHGIGFVLSLFGAVVLLPRAAESSSWALVSCIFYSLALSGLYLTSTLSHMIRHDQQRAFFRQLDQAFIYFLITASFTPYAVASLCQTNWMIMLGLMWVLSITGFASKVFFAHGVESVSIWIYLLLGWIPFLSGMLFCLPAGPFWAIVIGGIFYSGGTWFLFNDRIRWYFHAIWHVFVIAGSVTHYLGILWFACLPAA